MGSMMRKQSLGLGAPSCKIPLSRSGLARAPACVPLLAPTSTYGQAGMSYSRSRGLSTVESACRQGKDKREGANKCSLSGAVDFTSIRIVVARLPTVITVGEIVTPIYMQDAKQRVPAHGRSPPKQDLMSRKLWRADGRALLASSRSSLSRCSALR